MIAKTIRAALATTALVTVSFATQAHAQLPSLANAGGATVSTSGNVTTVNLNDASRVMQWNSFDVGPNAAVNFTTANTTTPLAVLNRVIGPTFSDISGAINAQSNVNVWLLNPNGIVFGGASAVNTGGFFASTLSVADNDFLDYYNGTNNTGNGTNNVRFSGASSASAGISAAAGSSITTAGALGVVAPSIDLNGTFTAGGGAGVAAGTDVQLNLTPGSPLSVAITTGTAVANAFKLNGTLGALNAALYSKSTVNNTMTVNATIATSGAGGIRLEALRTSAETNNISATTLTAGNTGSISVINNTQDGAITLASAKTTGSGNISFQNTIGGSGDLTITSADSAGTLSLYASRSLKADTLTAAGQIIGNVSNGTIAGRTTSGINATSNGSGVQLIAAGQNTVGNIVAAGQADLRSSADLFLLGNVTAGASILSVGRSIYTNDNKTYKAVADITLVANGTGAIGGSFPPGTITLARGATFMADSDGTGVATRRIILDATNYISSSIVNVANPASFYAGPNGTGQVGVRFNNAIEGFAIGNVYANSFGVANSTYTTITNAITAPYIYVGNLTLGSGISLTATNGFIEGRTINAAGDVNLTATSYIANSRAVSGFNIFATGSIIADSNAQIAFQDLSAGANIAIGTVRSASDVSIFGNVTSGVHYSVAGDRVYLGKAATALTQSAKGNVSITARSGALTGYAGLTLMSNSDGVGNESLSLGYNSVGGLQFGGTTLKGGPNKQSDVFLLPTTDSALNSALTVGDIAALTLTTRQDTTYYNGLYTRGDLTAGYVDVTNNGTVLRSIGGKITFGGAKSASNTVFVQATGDVVGTGPIDAPYVNIESTGYGISITGKITAPQVTFYSLGATTANAANAVGILGATATGGLQFNNTGNLLLSTINTDANAATIKTSGNLTISSGATVTGSVVALSAGGAFINNRTASVPISASDHWVVYAANPTGNTFGNLNSNNTAIWNANIATLAATAVSGNRYVFGYQPTVTITTTDANKTYGTDLTGGLGSNWTASGFHPGVAGAFLADTAANVLTGAPSISSLGAAANARVAGSPYTIDIAQGTLGVNRGYSLVLSNAGRLAIVAKAITASVTANNKTYDGSATGTGTVTLNGTLAGDAVGTTGTTFTFANRNAGTGKTVTVSGTTLTGADGGNYTLTVPTSTIADIIAKAIGATVIANNKTYDGSATGAGTVTLTGVVSGDDVGTTGTTFTFANRNAGAGKTVSIAGTTLTGADAGNYTLTVPTTTLADIFAKAIGATVVADNKTYDGGTAGTGTVTLNGVVSGDTVGTTGTTFTFANRNAGAGKTVTVAGTTLTGADAGNYTLTVPTSTLADIIAKAITATVVANNKTYDGTAAGTGTVTLNGTVSGDAVGTTGTTFTFANRNAGTGKTVTVAGTTLTGADAGNYTLTVPTSTLGDIFAKAISATVTANNKTYDGSVAGSGTILLNGVIAGDTVGTTGTTFTFANRNAGSGKTVTVAGTTLTGTDASNYTLTVPASTLADIFAKAITASVSANSKTYDGSTAGSGTISLNGVIAGDTVGTSGTTFTFDNKNAGAGKTVNVGGTTLTGADAGNYTLTVPSSTLADIFAKAITASVNVSNKTYDGTTAGAGTVSLNGIVSGDAVGTTGTTFTFANRNAGAGKTVTVAGTTLTGADAGNYTLTVPTSALADILAKAVSASVVANSKTYDGTTAGSGTVTLNGVIAGDSVGTSGTTFTFANKNAGAGKTVSIAGTTLTGADAGNYTLSVPFTALADIFSKAIGATVTANGKTYDGTTAGSGAIALNGVVAGDSVGTSGTTFTFANKNAGVGKTVTVAGTTLTGADAGNYTLNVPATALADILAKAITASVAANSKTYDGTVAGTGTVTLNGIVVGDMVGTTGTTFTFADRNAGTGKTVSVAGTTLTGADAGNYTLTVPGSTVADILRRILSISAISVTKGEGTGDPAFGYTITGPGLVSGDTLSGSLARQPGETPGQYAIRQGTLTAGVNYDLRFIDGVLTITPTPVEPNVPAAASQQATVPLMRVTVLPSAAGNQQPASVEINPDVLCSAGDEGCAATGR